jgi:CRISPR-associated exonuclease Cas4
MYPESDLLPISALQHLLLCERQCALIHLERLWAENLLTLEGRHLHERAHGGRGEQRGAVRTGRGVALRSLRLGLFGQADVVEMRRDGDERAVAFPVEYKRGRPKKGPEDRVQLCAQALCLEEMLGVPVPAGALFYGKIRRREEVAIDAALRRVTLEAIERLHELIASGRTPPARREKKCDRCSLLHLCLPGVLEGSESASRYLRRTVGLATAGSGPVSDG